MTFKQPHSKSSFTPNIRICVASWVCLTHKRVPIHTYHLSLRACVVTKGMPTEDFTVVKREIRVRKGGINQ